MAFIGFRHKLSSDNVPLITRNGSKYTPFGSEIRELEMCGVVVEDGRRYFTICDFHGVASMFKSQELGSCQGSAVFTVKPFERNGKVELYCRSITAVSLYEEMAFNLEIMALKEERCYFS